MPIKYISLNKSHKLSIIVPNYNGLNYIRCCMDSISMQSFKDFEIIIIDNDSKDGSREFISKTYPKIKLIPLKENCGFSKAVNEGIKAAKGEYIVLLNNDTMVDSHWLENLVKCIEEDKKIFSCCSKMIRYSKRDKIDDAGDGYNIFGWAYKRGDGASVDKYCRSESVFSSCAGATIYRKGILDEIGYFDENFFAYMEDVDISFRAKIHGYRNVYCSDAIVYHVGSATSGSKYNSFKVKLAARNNIYVIHKNMPFLMLIVNLPFLLLGFIIKGLFFVVKGFGKEYMHGIYEGISGISKIKKIKFQRKYFINYVKIEWKMILNTFKYIFNKLFKY